MLYHRDEDGSFLLVAANGTADWNPDWFHNLVSDPQVAVEVDGTQVPGYATVLKDQERAAVWPVVIDAFAGLAEAQAKTAREIPVVRVVPG